MIEEERRERERESGVAVIEKNLIFLNLPPFVELLGGVGGGRLFVINGAICLLTHPHCLICTKVDTQSPERQDRCGRMYVLPEGSPEQYA